MARTNEQAVRALTNASDDLPVQGFIDDASTVVNDLLTSDGVTPIPPNTENKLTLIEKLLAGHFYVLTQESGGLRSERIGDSEQEYNGTDSRMTGFMSTRFGQQAVALDATNNLLGVSTNKKKAQFRVL